MGAIVNILMAVIFGIGGIFLAVILVLWNRECQQEMGILLSLGCGKKNILFQLILENSSLFLVSYLVAVPAMEAGKQVINGWLSAGAADLQWMQICTVGIAGWLGCVLVTGLAAVTVMRKSPTELLSAVV